MEACQDHRSSRVVLLWAARRAENTRFVHVKAAAFGQTGYLVMARARNPLATPIGYRAAANSEARCQSCGATEGVDKRGLSADRFAHTAPYSGNLNNVNSGKSEYDLSVYAAILSAASKGAKGSLGMDKRQMAGLRMVAARQAHGVSQADAARHLGVSPSKLANWEKGAHSPNDDTLHLFCDIYDVPADWIIRGRTPGVPAERAAELRKILDDVIREREARQQAG